MYHKYIYIVLCLAIVGSAGYGYYSGRRVRELDTESRILREDLANIGRRYTTLEGKYQVIAAENRKFQEEISNGLTGIYDGTSDIEQRLQNLRKKNAGLASEMRAYAEKSNPPQ